MFTTVLFGKLKAEKRKKRIIRRLGIIFTLSEWNVLSTLFDKAFEYIRNSPGVLLRVPVAPSNRVKRVRREKLSFAARTICRPCPGTAIIIITSMIIVTNFQRLI